MTRKKLEALAWKHTHTDYRGKWADGTKTVLRMVPNVGTCAVAISSLTDGELLAKIPASVLSKIES